jgi:DNA-directed RNA polymerase specialized sigma24 family protein
MKKLDGLIEVYQQTGEDDILGILYHELEMLVFKLSSSYWGLTKEDVSSFAFETIYQCLQTYKIDGGAKFTSYFATSFKFRLRAETMALSQQKRKANLIAVSYEELLEEGLDTGISSSYDIIIMDAIDRLDLTSNEQKYCRLILEGKYNNTEIANILGLSVMSLSNMRKRLRIKLADVFITQ